MDIQPPSRPSNAAFVRKVVLALLVLAGNLSSAFAVDLSIAYSQSPGDQALIVSFFNRKTVGSALVGTLQIQNLSGTWVYIEQDLTSSPSPVAMPYTIYLLGPGAIKTFQSFSFQQGSYLKLTATTPVGLDFTHPNEKSTALEGALAVDLMTRGLLTFSLPGDAFDQPPVGEVVEPLLDTIVSTASPIGEVVNAIKDRSATEAAQAVLDIAADSKDVEANLAAVLKKYVTADQVHSALGLLGEILDLPEKASLLTDLTAMTFQAPPGSWSRMDVVARTQAASIAYVSPATLTTMPVPQTQQLTIHGAGFTSSSSLIFSIGTATYPSRPERLHFIDANTLEYDIAVGSAVGTWTVVLAEGSGSATFQVTASSSSLYTITPLSGPHGSIYPSAQLSKAGGESQTFTATPQDSTYTVDSWYVDGTLIVNAGNTFTLPDIQAAHSVYVTFKPNAPSSQTGGLTVTLQPQGAISAGAQWQVDGGNYRNSGDIVTGLTPGSHTIACKAVMGYSASASHSVSITGGTVANDTETYSIIAPSTYTLTLNYDSSQGSASAWPAPGTAGYAAGTIVQLSASTQFNHRFTGWSGDASGTANPTNVVMDRSKSVTANFAAGDPALGTLTVTIQPSDAATAGVTWGFNDSDFRASGSSVTTFPGSYYIVLHSVPGWLGPTLQLMTITAGQTANVGVTFTPDPTPGMLVVTIDPPAVAAAGAKCHVNGGAGQGNGATLSLAPGPYTVSFDSVAGWTAPPSQNVQVARAQTTVVSGDYTPPPGLPVIVGMSPSVGPLSGGTAITLAGLNFASPATVSVGGKPANGVTVVSASQITCLTPSSTVYGSAPVVLHTPGGNATNLNGFAYEVPRGNGIELAGSIGGVVNAVAAQGNVCYIGEGSTFTILDISSPSAPTPLGRVPLPAVIQDIALFGASGRQYAIVADDDAGLQIVDVTVPGAPALIGFYNTGDTALGIAVLGGYAYVGNGNAGLMTLDISSPAKVHLVGSVSTGGLANRLAVRMSGGRLLAYLVNSGALQIVDVSDSAHPALLGKTSQLLTQWYSPNSIAVINNQAYLADGYGYGYGQAVDVTDPQSPTALGAVFWDAPSAVAAAGGLIYTWASDGLAIYNYPGGTSQRVGYSSLSGGLMQGSSLAIASGRAICAGNEHCISIYDVSSASTPNPAGKFSASAGYAVSVAVNGNNAALVTQNSGLKLIDVSNPSSPRLTSQYVPSYNGGFGGEKVALGGSRAYFLSSHQLNVLDVSNPSQQPPLLGTTSPNQFLIWDFYLSGTSAVAGGSDATLTPYQAAVALFNANNPASIGMGTLFHFSGQSGGVGSITGNGSLACAAAPDGSIVIVNISNAGNPRQLGRFVNAGNVRCMRLAPDNRYLYIGCYDSNWKIVDLRDSTSPSLVSSNSIDSTVGAVNFCGGAAIVAEGKSILAYDVSDPSQPRLLRSYTTPSFASDVQVSGSSLYVANSTAGLTMLNLTDIDPPEVFITTPTLSPICTNTDGIIDLGGSADDDLGLVPGSVTRITWSNSRGGGGDASGTTSWFAGGVVLQPGTNILTVTALDQAGNTSSAQLVVLYQTPKQDQTISFTGIADHTYGDPPIQLLAAASSGLPATFSVVSGPATLTSSNVLRLTGAGAVTVQAEQPGNDSLNAAPPVHVSFNVARADQSIAFAPLPDKSAGDAPFTLTATASSGLPVYFSILSGSAVVDTNNTLTLFGAGSVTVLAWEPSNSNYNAAATVQRSFNVTKIPQTITFGALSSQKQGDAPFPLNATASSGLLVNYSVSGPATLSGNILTLTGYGTVTVTASQPGNNTYAAASEVTQSVVVAAPDNTLVGLGFSNNGGFQLAFYGMAGSNYMVQASSNLLNWQPFTNFIITGPPYNFTDPAATNFNRRFYRAVLP